MRPERRLPLPIELESRQTGAMPRSSSTGTALRAVLFTDIVGSTELARELGDERWSRLLAAHFRVLRAALKATRGRQVDTAGDGMFAVFESPADAVRCAFSATRGVQELGLDIRAGIHFGEIETAGSEVRGIVVHTGARVMGLAGPAEVLITQTVRDLVAGSRFRTAERGSFELKGVPGTWVIHDVTAIDDELRPQPIEGASVASERRERAAAMPAPRRNRRLVPLAIATAAVVAVAAVIIATRSAPTYVPGVGSVASIQEGALFGAPIAVGGFPISMTFGQGKVWVMDRRAQVYWFAPAADHASSRGTTGIPTGVAVGGGSVWITNGFGTGQGPGGGVIRLDPSTGDTSPAFDTPIGTEGITYGADAVWVTDHSTASITRYDPVQRASTTVALPGSSSDRIEPDAIAFSDMSGENVWVGDDAHPQVFRVDANDPKNVHTSAIGGPATSIAAGAGAIWVASEDADAVYRLDPASGAVKTSIDVGKAGCNAPVAIATGKDGVWVACSLSQRLVRIDPATSTVDATLKVNGAPGALAADGSGVVWVAVQPP
jgi:class 3 adenylate cyclase/streptogramin lyase